MKKEIVAALALLAASNIASATVLSFDDTSYQGSYWGDMESGYGGFTWSSNFDVYNGPGINAAYDAGTVSGDFAAFNSYGVDVSVTGAEFDWTGAWFNDPHNNSVITLSGSRNGTVLYTENLQLSYSNATWFQADWLDIDTITINVADRDWFTMDDFTINETRVEVPEPTGLALLGLGLLGIGFSRKRKSA